ncbi:sugar-binding protein [Pseudomonas putida]|uniref:RHS repeat-associated core domain-containing protein n=1 Tax=Pseudomonas putida TaxID=303 RepID=UPI00137696D1|nr:RHS repeat-associated core domain-containing protein [Pseudomonas putida]NBA83106.1 sugar-binding protein [Pseudomonas putida]
MAIQSNATNFMSHTQGSVDPRTGLYTFSIEIPPLNANDLQGPELPLKLTFNPLSELNSGFGIGWSLKLSRYNLDSDVLDLHTGESYAIADNGANRPIVVHEQKIENFHVENVSDDKGKRYRIAHKAGLVEILEPLKADPRSYLPTRVMAPSGHGITLGYNESTGELESIHDDSGQKLLTVTPNGDHQTVLDLHPDTEAHASIKMGFAGEELRTLTMPSTEQTSWTFYYVAYGPLRCLEKLVNPRGGEETVTYKEQGHKLPGVNLFVPCATHHTAKPNPLDETTFITSEYSFSSNNFLGNGAPGIVWEENYSQDQLYKFTGSEFNYTSTVKHLYNEEVLRTVTRTFNRFHLLTKQVTEESGCTETLTNEYHDSNGNFASQDERLQLPRKLTKTWTVKGNPVDRRDDTLTTIYDKAGNLLEELHPDGRRMVRTYYPPSGGVGCPADPEGFKRNLESLTIYPASDATTDKPAPIIRTRYTYKVMPLLSATASLQQANHWLVAGSEDKLVVTLDDAGNETEQQLHHLEMSHLNMPGNVFLHGRSNARTSTLGACTATTRWHYEKVQDEQGKSTYLKTTTTFAPHGGTIEKTSTCIHSLLRNSIIEDEDANGVVTRYRYDSLNRLLEQTVSPEDDPATLVYQYGSITEDNRLLCYTQVTNAKQVVSRIYYDGLDRPVREERILKDQNAPDKTVTRKTAEVRYDSIGRVESETRFDYFPAPADGNPPTETVIELTKRYAYDAWGQRCSVTHPDNVKEITEFSPFGTEGNKTTTWLVSPEKPDDKQLLRVEETNRAGKPLYQYKLLPVKDKETDLISWVQIDRTDYTYDGLARCIKESFSPTQTRKQKALVTEYTYDHWGRMCETVRPDGSKLRRLFAPHSITELTTLLEVLDTDNEPAQAVCKRNYDGLDRLTRMEVGPRVETYEYRGLTQLIIKRSVSNSESADERTHVTHYEHTPNLTIEPTRVTATFENTSQPNAPDKADFGYFSEDAKISSAANSNGKRTYLYTDQGYLAEEHWEVQGQTNYGIENMYSLEGLVTFRKHSDGSACHYGYDAQGRLRTVTQGELQCTLEYNSEGLLEHTTTRDSERYVRTTQTYDALGRQHRRTLDANGEIWVLVLQWRDGTHLDSRTLYRNSDEDENAFIRRERFDYDDLDRLVIHDFEGDWENEEEDGERRQALPRNAAGRSIISQTFVFDALDNLQRCRTDFADENRDIAKFSYADDGSFQLTKVNHTLLEDYREEQTFAYDARGNMLNDEQGRKLEYDSHGRLHRVLETNDVELMKYLYDGHDQLLATVAAGKAQVQRRYLGNSLDCTRENDVLTQYLYSNGQAVGIQRTNQDTNQLLLTDPAGSVVAEVDADGTRHASYSAYGERPTDNGMRSLLAFNGEVREVALGWYLLGRGYRAYNPNLMRFHSPDSMPPEVSGPNPYVYALGNPVRWRDPTGHRAASISAGDQPPEFVDPPPTPRGSDFPWLIFTVSLIVFTVSAGLFALPLLAGAAVATSTMIKAGIAVIGQGIAATLQGFSAAAKDPEKANLLQYFGFGVSAITGFVGTGSLISMFRTFNAARGASVVVTTASASTRASMTSTTSVLSTAGDLAADLPAGSTTIPRVQLEKVRPVPPAQSSRRSSGGGAPGNDSSPTQPAEPASDSSTTANIISGEAPSTSAVNSSAQGEMKARVQTSGETPKGPRWSGDGREIAHPWNIKRTPK